MPIGHEFNTLRDTTDFEKGRNKAMSEENGSVSKTLIPPGLKARVAAILLGQQCD